MTHESPAPAVHVAAQALLDALDAALVINRQAEVYVRMTPDVRATRLALMAALAAAAPPRRYPERLRQVIAKYDDDIRAAERLRETARRELALAEEEATCGG